MALVFELVVNYGQNHAAAEQAVRVAAAHPPLAVGGHRIPLHPPSMSTIHSAEDGSYLELSVVPVGIGSGVPLDRNRDRLHLTGEELSDVGRGLYSLLAKFRGYRAAFVGWDPETFVDPTELRTEWAEELSAGELSGLVLAEELHRLLPHSRGFQPFAPGHVWIPYTGERPSSLTADQG
jgi:hypothetical protein